jgi:heme/copper-type cytochrome/quinol oxidase subunit 1
MNTGIIINAIVIVGVIYLSFVMALAGWISALRKGQAVTLLPERGSKSSTLWLQLGMVGVSLLVCALLIYFLWILFLSGSLRSPKASL